MATMAKWGPKTWAVSSQKVVALQGLSFSYAQVADNNASTEEKKTTNERGTELFPLSFFDLSGIAKSSLDVLGFYLAYLNALASVVIRLKRHDYITSTSATL